jgi:hypothetical protein
MKLSKFFLFLTFITFFCLLYVYQQSEIFRLAYVGEKKIAEFQDLLDKNTLLRYNIESSASLIRITNKVSPGEDYEMPHTFHLVKFSHPQEAKKRVKGIAKKENIIARIFSIKRQAEAKTVNP